MLFNTYHIEVPYKYYVCSLFIFPVKQKVSLNRPLGRFSQRVNMSVCELRMYYDWVTSGLNVCYKCVMSFFYKCVTSVF